MRDLAKNQIKMHYSTYDEEITVYEKDAHGNTVYVTIDGEQVPVVKCEKAGYNNPVEFEASFSTSGGDADQKEYGNDIGSYEAIILTVDKSLPISETSRIWVESEPQYDNDDNVLADSADYSILAVKPSLDGMKYLLKKLTKGSA